MLVNEHEKNIASGTTTSVGKHNKLSLKFLTHSLTLSKSNKVDIGYCGGDTDLFSPTSELTNELQL